MPVLNGLGVSAGRAHGRALVMRTRRRQVFYLIPDTRIDAELKRLADAQARSRVQLEDISSRLARLAGPGPASLFEAQLLMLEDPMLIGRASQLIRTERHNAEWALQHAADELIDILGEGRDPYLRERHGDVRDVVGRLILNLRGEARQLTVPDSAEPWILVADDLPPSIAAQVDWQQAAGFVTEAGSWTSHTAILARSLGVPAVVGVPGATTAIRPGAEVYVDGGAGECLVDPDEAARERWLHRIATGETPEPWPADGTGPLRTLDGVELRIDANLERVSELDDAIAAGASSIGLFRSEFMLRPDGHLPDEAAQRELYRALLASTPGEVTIRTFDLEADPAVRPLGLRALQVDAGARAQFGVQVRALLTAASAGRLRILLPFVTDVEDFLAARAIITQVADGLRAAGQDVPPVPLGAMVEVPSAALTADRLLAHADFLSIGTNDLVALTLSVDRNDQRASRFYDPLHPSVLRLVRLVIRAGARKGRRVAVCGEMAADPRALVALLGLGIREVSMAPAAIARARQVVAHVSAREARAVVRQAFRDPDRFARELDELVQHALEARVPY